jgi:diguanylate cyclase (GGDEF)-like protein
MPAKKLRFGIAAKTVVFVCVLVVAAASVILSVGINMGRASLLEGARERARELAETVSMLAGPELAAGDAAKATETLQAFRAQLPVSYVYVVGTDGRIVAGERVLTQPEAAADPLVARAQTEQATASEVRDSHIHLAKPLIEDGQSIGVLRLGFSLAPIESRVIVARYKLGLLTLLAVLVLAPLFGVCIWLTMHPIRQLIDAADKIARRDFNIDLKVKTGDELQVLAEALNDMASHVRGSMMRIRQLAFIDALTRLPNKTGFIEQARKILAESDMPSAALLIDLDRFKRLNDIYGPREGDKILAAAGQRMHAAARRVAEQFRHPDARPPLLARFSGDEYALLICGPSPTGAARAAAEEILASFREPFPLNEGEAVITASIGISRAPIDGREIEELIRLSNLALDGVKADGGNGYRFFEMEMTRRAVQRMTLENELRRAIANREFIVYYQPKVNARSGEINGCEALVRWRRGGKIVGPAAFITAAEDCGLIGEIGDFVLEEACSAAARWRAKGLECSVAVNVSAIQFQSSDFSRRVLEVLETTGLPPQRLELELTESVAMRDPDEVIKQVHPMREKGVRFAIDDFGTGHSSLSTLTRLPFDTFKIDQSFVRQMETDPSARVVVETILAMARALGYDTVGEGVETPTQFAFLRLNGCTTAQGWYFGKPAPEAEFVARLQVDRRVAQHVAQQEAAQHSAPHSDGQRKAG